MLLVWLMKKYICRSIVKRHSNIKIGQKDKRNSKSWISHKVKRIFNAWDLFGSNNRSEKYALIRKVSLTGVSLSLLFCVSCARFSDQVVFLFPQLNHRPIPSIIRSCRSKVSNAHRFIRSRCSVNLLLSAAMAPVPNCRNP